MDDDVCPINIGAAGQRARRVMGILSLVVAAGLGLYMVYADAPRPARLAVGVPVFAGFLGLLQAKRKTCVVLAARNARDIGQGIQTIDNPAHAKRLREQGLTVLFLSAGAALAAAVAFWLLP